MVPMRDKLNILFGDIVELEFKHDNSIWVGRLHRAEQFPDNRCSLKRGWYCLTPVEGQNYYTLYFGVSHVRRVKRYGK